MTPPVDPTALTALAAGHERDAAELMRVGREPFLTIAATLRRAASELRGLAASLASPATPATEGQPPLLTYMTTESKELRGAAYLRMHASRVRNGTSTTEDIPNTIAATLEGIAAHLESLAPAEGQKDDAMRAVWALWDHLKALGHPFDSWPDAVKDAAANAIIDKSPLTPAELQHAQEVVARLNLEPEGQGHAATPAGDEGEK